MKEKERYISKLAMKVFILFFFFFFPKRLHTFILGVNFTMISLSGLVVNLEIIWGSSCPLTACSNLKFAIIFARATLVSKREILIPTQLLLPAPKGIQARGSV